MSLTRARLNEILSRGRLFCDFWVIGYFLGLSWNQVDHMYESGRLPKALCADGNDYRPSGERLVLADKFGAMLPQNRQLDFEVWRKHGFEVAPSSSRDSEPAEFGSHRMRAVAITAPLTVSQPKPPTSLRSLD